MYGKTAGKLNAHSASRLLMAIMFSERRRKKHRLVVEVESLVSSSKIYIKSRRTFNK